MRSVSSARWRKLSRTYQQVAVRDADGNVNMCAVLSKIDVVISDRDGEVSFRYVAPALAHLYSNPAIRAKVPDPYWGFIRNRLQTLEGRLCTVRSPRMARLRRGHCRPSNGWNRWRSARTSSPCWHAPGHSLDRRRLSASSDAPHHNRLGAEELAPHAQTSSPWSARIGGTIRAR